MKTEIKELYRNEKEYIGAEIELCGWVKTVRSSGKIGFLEITDGSFFRSLQAVFDSNTKFIRDDEVLPPAFEKIEKLMHYESEFNLCNHIKKSLPDRAVVAGV